MGGGTHSVASPLDGRVVRTVPPGSVRELTIAEQVDVVDVRRPENGARTWSMPLSGVAIQALDRDDRPIAVRALRDGAALVIGTGQRVRLPGGAEVTVETEERHVLLADGSLQVTTVARTGNVTQTRQLIYRRVE